MRNPRRRCLAAVVLAILFAGVCRADSDHPRLFVPNSDRDAIIAKIDKYPWAHQAYQSLKSEVDHYLALTAADPKWMISRLQMNWQTHYETPLVRNERSAGGEGFAPVPTPRFAGARDWATHYHLPAKLEDFRPYNDNHGQIFLIDDRTNTGGWVDPGLTGRTIEVANARILQLAANAGFVYWLTGDEKYARFGSEILCTFMDGFSHIQLPRDLSGRRNQIIGMMSFEVIHEDSMLPSGEAYDFFHDYLTAHGRDVGLIAKQLKRWADRVIDGGSATGNWNLNQAKEIAPATLVLDDNSAYPDHKGRQYYVDVLLNARLPAQTGILHVLREGYDLKTGLWPEAPGYGFGTTPQIEQIASYMSGDPDGRRVLADPMLSKAIMAQLQLLYPNGWSIGWGDTDNTRVSAVGLELLIAAARRQGNAPLELQLTAALRHEIDGGFYNRAAQANIGAITQYVGELLPASANLAPLSRTYLGPPLNVLIQRNGTDLMAALYGTAGGHAHANGLNMELFGDGLIMGADPGRGVSYWQPDQRDYYSQPPASNTVIVDASSTYPPQGPGHIAMRVEAMEPNDGEPANSANVSYATCSFQYNHPPSQQERTVALVRTGDGKGFYFDVFRSRLTSGGTQFHDYLYHNIGQRFSLSDDNGRPLPLASSLLLGTAQGDLPGYNYFKNERSLDFFGDLHGQFVAQLPDGSDHTMNLWMCGSPNRRVFSLEAPPDHAGREALPAELNSIPMPTLLVRQKGPAWDAPFIAVYEPGRGTIRSVHSVDVNDGPNVAACEVTGNSFSALLAQDDKPTSPHRVDGFNFQGGFAAIVQHDDKVTELYLGHGLTLDNDQLSISARGGEPIDADLTRTDAGWVYSSSGPIEVVLSTAKFDLPAGHNAIVKQP
jgi:hypothetical protein